MIVKIKKSVLVVLILVVILNCAIAMAGEIALTLDEAAALALRNNRDVLFKAEEVLKAKQKVAEAKADLLPTLDFTATISDTRGYYAKDLTQKTTQTTLKQYLYKGGEIVNTIQYNKYDFLVQKALLDKEKLATAASVENAFYTLLLAEDFAALNKQILENTKEHLKVLKERFKSGQASEQEILNIEASLSSTQEVYEASLNEVESGCVLLNSLLYLGDDVRVRTKGELVYQPIDVAYDEAFLKAMSKSPQIKQYQAQEKADKKYIEVVKADARPNIYASWDYYSRDHVSLSTTKGWNDYNVIGVTVTWPIFDGWATKAKVQQAIVDLKQTKLLKEKAVKDIATDLKNAYISLKNAIAKMQSVESDIKFYNDSLISVKEKYQRGITSELDAEDAGLKYEVSLFNKKQAIYDYIVAKISFDKAQGGI